MSATTAFTATDAVFSEEGLTVKPSTRSPGDALFVAHSEQSQTVIVLDREDVSRLRDHLTALLAETAETQR